jgi:hypothetical protein
MEVHLGISNMEQHAMPRLPFTNATLSADTVASPTSPLLVTIDHAIRQTGWSRQRVYRLLIVGHLRAVKDGTRTLIVWDSVLSYIATLPLARFNMPRQTSPDARQGEHELDVSHPREESDV